MIFGSLRKFKRIIVSGPQRSGTRVCAQMIANDLNYCYMDERVIHINNKEKFGNFVKAERVVIQCPGMARWVHEYSANDTAIVFMIRDVKDIIASQERIGWPFEPDELSKYGKDEGIISEIKYKFWKKYQKAKIVNAFEIKYEDLKKHPYWIDKKDRKDFDWYRTDIKT